MEALAKGRDRSRRGHARCHWLVSAKPSEWTCPHIAAFEDDPNLNWNVAVGMIQSGREADARCRRRAGSVACRRHAGPDLRALRHRIAAAAMNAGLRSLTSGWLRWSGSRSGIGRSDCLMTRPLTVRYGSMTRSR